ncbi:Der GTPase-activating protein YihI [Vibrio sp. MACH09]|uniref:Der GTPase-activating protein YihI n=1 Tax=Vibrio sp. MACH09 TaxID=3025122 RepID=UPI0027923BEF|nr:Der GTPase-activating protein YihI [Vibrio sp. MACH09]GLO59540.1 Der GTPase-activating protein YihI [Vibrio sp. MACH09]
MSRNKKSRKPGSTGDVDIIVTRNRSEADVEGRLRKRLKKRKGLKTGSRHSDSVESKQYQGGQKKDPRLGSKKKIPLIVEAKKKPTKQQRRLSAEEELETLENDAQLNVLLDRLENGENLGAGLQKYVDEKMDRIEILMNQLGLLDPEESEDDDLDDQEVPSVVPQVVEKQPSRKNLTDEELLSQFEGLDMDDFKG